LINDYGESKIQSFAGIEWEDMKNSGGKAPMTGALKCECKKEIHDAGTLGLMYIYNKEYNYTNT
jgi:hypothetical protein